MPEHGANTTFNSFSLEEVMASHRKAVRPVTAEMRRQVLEDLPEKLASRVADYYEQAIKAGVYSCTGGSPESAKNDIAVLQKAGQLKGSEKDLSVDKFWYFEPLQKAKATLGIKN